jgi:hypothetical protein
MHVAKTSGSYKTNITSQGQIYFTQRYFIQIDFIHLEMSANLNTAQKIPKILDL